MVATDSDLAANTAGTTMTDIVAGQRAYALFIAKALLHFRNNLCKGLSNTCCAQESVKITIEARANGNSQDMLLLSVIASSPNHCATDASQL